MLTSFGLFWRRLEKAKAELAELDVALTLTSAETATPWSRRALKAFTVEGVYSGLEAILKIIADEVDGSLPSGVAWHALLLETMVEPRPGVRPPVLSETSFHLLDRLRRFRHIVRNNYALDLEDEGVERNLADMRAALETFETDLRAFEAAMTGGAAPP